MTTASLSTPRLRLRPPSVEDAEAIFAAYGSDPDVSRFLTWRTHRDVGDARAFVEAALAGWRDGSNTPYLAWDGPTLVGAAGLERLHGGGLRLGYLVRRDRWGTGLAGELVETLVGEARRRGAAVEALVEPGHHRSIRVLEKAGFRRAGEGRAVHPNLGEGKRTVLRFVRRQD